AIGTSSVAALQQFALLGVLGLAGALLASLTLLPAMLTLLERIGRSGVEHVGALRFDAAKLLQIAHRHRRSCWATAAVLTGAAGITLVIAGGVPFDDDLQAMHPQPNKPLATQTQIATMFGQAPEPMVVLLEAGDESALLDLAARVDHHIDASAAAQAAGVRATLSPARLLPTAAHVDRRVSRLQEIGVTSMLASFDAVIEESIFNPDAYADYREYLRHVVRPEDSPTINTLRHYPQLAAMVLPRIDHESVAHMGAVLVYFEDRVTNREQRDAAVTALREALTHVEGATLSGMPVIAHDVEQAVRTELGQLFGVAATLVIAWLILIYRNGRDVALVLIPAVFGALILLSGMYWMGIGFNMMNLIALPLLAGIGVDDGIFLVSAARQRQTGGVAASCHAITMTSATTALAFGSLLLTSTPAIQSLGAVLAIGIVASYIGAAWVLAPWLIENIEREPAA
ncbi:MAG: MMPL family transporter, partial [Phycisphaeraceae bacterium]